MTSIRVTTAVDVSKEQRSFIEASLTQKLKSQDLKFEYVVDPQVIGGIKLTYGSKELDGTLAARLQQIRSTLVERV